MWAGNKSSGEYAKFIRSSSRYTVKTEFLSILFSYKKTKEVLILSRALTCGWHI
jgi:hypothetical protein